MLKLKYQSVINPLMSLSLFLALLAIATWHVVRADFKDSEFIVLNYHDIVEVNGVRTPLNGTDVSINHLQEQLDWLSSNGYHFISVQQVLDAQAGIVKLPDQAVLLTFDDGYQSVYTRVFPLLKKYHLPATIALVGAWMEAKNIPADINKPFLTWAQALEMVESGWVEIASHSYDLHHGIMANPQGNTQAAVVTRLYDRDTKFYEADDHYSKRILDDLQASSATIFQHIGVKPRVMVWPYGEYNSAAIVAAQKLGMPITMGLQDGKNKLSDLAALRRLIIVEDPDLQSFINIVTKQRSDQKLRVVHVDLDYLYDNNPEQTEHNIKALLDRISAMQVNTVFLQAYADPDGDGNADALYFPNRHMPVKQDLFSRVAWQLKTVSRVKVYAWMPIFAYQNHLPAAWYVQEWRDGKAQTASHIYTRLSPFQPQARQYISDIYEDLAKYCNFDGILFHDDGILSDFEDVSAMALAYTYKVWGLPKKFMSLHETGAMRLAWAEHKTEFINAFTDSLAANVKEYRPDIKTARNIYTLPILKPFSEEWYAQSYPSFLAHYDYVAIEAMPFMEKADNPIQWLTELVQMARQQPEGLNKSVFELQAMDWDKHLKIPMDTFIGQVDLLKHLGVHHIGYYPDNVFENQPNLSELQQHFSVAKIP
ncbi:MAG: poly-beta-1,6-N-acetyl-D-glucosamine N-deacetylase PgaB [Methylococcaceae bacterium]|jgi:biofilm PGA synthesis lipoprotein PgaB